MITQNNLRTFISFGNYFHRSYGYVGIQAWNTYLKNKSRQDVFNSFLMQQYWVSDVCAKTAVIG